MSPALSDSVFASALSAPDLPISRVLAPVRCLRSHPGSLLPLLALALLVPLLASCQPQRTPTRLVVATKSRIDSVDPAKASRIGAMQVLSALGDPLYAITAEGRIEPRLATALPTISSDGLRARIPLRRGVLFHDGTPFDAAALVFSLKRFMAIGTLGYQLSDRVKEVRASGSHEVELELHQPFSPLPRLLSAIFLTPISPTAYRNHPDKPLNERFVGTGPYQLTFFGGQQVRLTPWRRYWGPKPANDGMDLVTLSNSTALFGALRSGEVDVLLSSGLEIDHEQALRRDALAGRLHEARGPALSIGFLSLLTDQPPLDNPSLRQAIAHSLDRQTISRRVSLGLRPPLRQLVPPSLPGSDPSAWPAYDPAEARRLYRAAGYCDGKRFILPLTFRSDIPSDRLFALTWQAQLRRDLGDCVTLEVSGMESTTAYDQLANGALVLFFYDWIGDYPDAENFLAPLLSCQEPQGNRCAKGNSALSGSFWTAPGLDLELVRSSQVEGPERIALLRAIQRRTAAAVPYLPVWLMEEGAWSGAGVSPPLFDGSGRVRLEALHRLGHGTDTRSGGEAGR
ncbi:ABC transporter substrate-binding protein [Synechococcus sp. CCY9202]|nr:ABC transporter substrate-binding protein [Synechococcus sp. CCY9202]